MTVDRWFRGPLRSPLGRRLFAAFLVVALSSVAVLTVAALVGTARDRVTVSGHRNEGLAVLEIADTGPGIPADELPHVFQRLWRGHQARSVAGSGIGLAVVRELVTVHGGTVSAAHPPVAAPPSSSNSRWSAQIVQIGQVPRMLCRWCEPMSVAGVLRTSPRA